MELLKGITRELKGSSEQDRSSDRDRSRPASGRASETRESASTSTTSETESASDSQRTDRTRDDEHVCAFCGTDFAASRGACPDCDAKIIVRGER